MRKHTQSSRENYSILDQGQQNSENLKPIHFTNEKKNRNKRCPSTMVCYFVQ